MPITLLNSEQIQLTINRLCHQIIEHFHSSEECIIIGLQPRGVLLGKRIVKQLEQLETEFNVTYGEIDISLYRDDFRRRELSNIKSSKMDFVIEDKRVILIDDVLYTGRSIRAGLDAMIDYGRPKEVQLLVLIDRRFSRQLPIEAKYIGKKVDSFAEQKVSVEWAEQEGNDRVVLFTEVENE